MKAGTFQWVEITRDGWAITEYVYDGERYQAQPTREEHR